MEICALSHKIQWLSQNSAISPFRNSEQASETTASSRYGLQLQDRYLTIPLQVHPYHCKGPVKIALPFRLYAHRQLQKSRKILNKIWYWRTLHKPDELLKFPFKSGTLNTDPTWRLACISACMGLCMSVPKTWAFAFLLWAHAWWQPCFERRRDCYHALL